MFDWLFNHPWTAFSRGDLLFLSGWPAWLLIAAIAAAAAALAASVLRVRSARRAALWGLQAAFVSLLILMLWRPAVSVSALKPHANIIAVLVDDSRSMAIREDGRARIDAVKELLAGSALADLSSRYDVRLYRFSNSAERIENAAALQASGSSSRIGEALDRVAADAASVPIGAVVLLSDGGDSSGGIDRDSVGRLRLRRIPVHAVGFGRESAGRDVEIAGITIPRRVLPGSRVRVEVALRSSGFKETKTRISVRDSGSVLASRDITLTGVEQNETLEFSAGEAGARTLEIAVAPVAGEENTANNRVTRIMAIDARRPRILYVEGEPRWEYKFIRRAMDDDAAVSVVSMLRTTENKIYRQGIRDAAELQTGFPSSPEELFRYDGLVIGSVDSSWFTVSQQEAIRQFAAVRGGGVLFLGGRAGLADGGYGRGPLAEMLPLELPERRGTFHRDPAAPRLTSAGIESPIVRLVNDPSANASRWQSLPPLADYQETGAPKPAAVVLAEMTVGNRTMPLLAIENYGRGRTAILATGGTWRWQMRLDHADQTHETFWRQLLRWVVEGTPSPVEAVTPLDVLSDDTRLRLRAEVRDAGFRPAPDARVEARILAPGGAASTVELAPNSEEPGVYTAEWNAAAPGSYVAEVVAWRGEEELGRDAVTVLREDGVAENFRTAQNRPLLETLAAETGGGYYRPSEASKLARDIEFSEAGVTVREARDIWNVPAMLILALMVRSAEWLLRRRWGFV
ncbi:MAG: hypothetical protein ACM3ZB_08910 [bacterium]